MKIKTLGKSLALLAIGVLAVGSAGASPITVLNNDFEAQTLAVNTGSQTVTNWTIQSNALADWGVYNNGGGNTPVAQTGYLTTGGVDPGFNFFYQDLGVAWAADTQYTLTFDVGQVNLYQFANLKAQLYSLTDGAIGTRYIGEAAWNSALAAPGSGNMSSYSLVVTTGAAAPTGNVVINFSVEQPSTAGIATAMFDNVSLDATAVPEPATWAMFASGLAFLVIMRKRKAVQL